MLVSSPPAAVPGFMVTPSRIRQSAPDAQARRLAAVFQVLRLVAQRREGEDPGPGTDRGAPGNHDMRQELHVIAEFDFGADDAERPDLDVAPEHRVGRHDGRSVDVGGGPDLSLFSSCHSTISLRSETLPTARRAGEVGMGIGRT